jgi:hypothetical protein
MQPSEGYRSYQGYLFSWSNPHGLITRTQLCECERLTFKRALVDGSDQENGWETFEFQATAPIMKEAPGLSVYPYEILCRRSGRRILLLAREREIVDELVARQLNKIFTPNLRPVLIRVGDIVRLLVEKPKKYVLTRAYTRVPGFGVFLSAISFYGDDLANAKLFRDLLPALNYTTIGLAELGGAGEIVIVGTSGRVTFSMTGVERLDEVEQALGYLSKSGFIDD